MIFLLNTFLGIACAVAAIALFIEGSQIHMGWTIMSVSLGFCILARLERSK